MKTVSEAAVQLQQQPDNLTRQELLKVAARLFREKGFRACSMQDIATELGMKKASIYYYIRTKTDLLEEISFTAMEMLVQAGERVAFSALNPSEKLRQLIHAHVNLICSHFDLFAVTLREFTPVNAASFWETVVALRDRYESLLRGIIKSGQEQGLFRDVSEKMTGFALLGMVNWLIRWYSPSGPATPEEIGDLWADLFLNGLQCPPPQ